MQKHSTSVIERQMTVVFRPRPLDRRRSSAASGSTASCTLGPNRGCRSCLVQAMPLAERRGRPTPLLRRIWGSLHSAPGESRQGCPFWMPKVLVVRRRRSPERERPRIGRVQFPTPLRVRVPATAAASYAVYLRLQECRPAYAGNIAKLNDDARALPHKRSKDHQAIARADVAAQAN